MLTSKNGCHCRERDPLAQWILESGSSAGQRQDGKRVSVPEQTQIANLWLPRVSHQVKGPKAGQQRANLD